MHYDRRSHITISRLWWTWDVSFCKDHIQVTLLLLLKSHEFLDNLQQFEQDKSPVLQAECLQQEFAIKHDFIKQFCVF